MSTSRVSQVLREPALLIDLGETLVIAVVAFGLPVSGDQQTYLVAAIVAAVGLLKAATTRPFAAGALTDFARAALVVAASFGVGLTSNQIAILVTLLGTVTTLVLRAQVTPRSDPVVVVGGAGAGPVSGEAGYAVLGALGLGLVVLSVILLVTTLLKAFVVAWPVLIVLFVVGLVLLFLDRGNTRGVV